MPIKKDIETLKKQIEEILSTDIDSLVPKELQREKDVTPVLHFFTKAQDYIRDINELDLDNLRFLTSSTFSGMNGLNPC